MKLFGMLRKPAWESRDAEERARAVAHEQDPAVLAKLPDFARGDDDARVRTAAVRRLRDLSLLGDRARHDGDAKVREAARERLFELLSSADALPLPERERFVRVEDDPDWLQAIATRASDAALRRVALERISRPALIAERCMKDPDAGIRAWLLTRIDNVATLQRIAESARKGDKQLARSARDLADRMRRDAGDPIALRERALALCDEFDALRRERPADVEARADALRAEWTALRDRVGDVLARRVDGYVEALRLALSPPAPVVLEPIATPDDAAPVAVESAPDATAPVLDTPVAAAEPEPTAPDAALAALADELEQRRETITRDALAGWRRRLERQQQGRAEHAIDAPSREKIAALLGVIGARHDDEARRAGEHEARIATLLATIEQATEAGQLAAARAAHAEVLAALDGLPRPLAAPLQARRAQAEVALDKLVTWQRWSNNKVRQRLCDEIEALHGAGLHPDAVANKVRDAQAEWARLDALEGITPDQAGESGLARRFRVLGHRALAPAREYFEKRRELRSGKKEDVEAIVARVDAIVKEDGVDARRLSQARGDVVERLRLLDELDPRARGPLGKRLRELLTALDARRDALRGDAEAEKRKVIANLKRKLAQVDLVEALRLAKDAQAQWQTLPRIGRAADDALYAELRAVVDPLFQRDQAQRAEHDAVRSQAMGEAQAVLDELAELARGDGDALRHADAKLAALSTRWRALAPEETPAADPRGDRRGGDARGAPPRGRGDARDGRGGGRDGGRDARGGRDRDAAPRRREHPREREFDRAVAAVQQSLDAAKRERRLAMRDNALAAVDALHQLELREVAGNSDGPAARDEAHARIAALEIEPAIRQALDARVAAVNATLSRLQSAEEASRLLAGNADAGDALAVRAECAAGIDSPAGSQARRREHQVRRLAQRMGGGAAAADDESAHAVLLAWIGLAPLSADAHREIGTRLRAALPELG